MRMPYLIILVNALLLLSCGVPDTSDKSTPQSVIIRLDHNERIFLNEAVVEISELAEKVDEATERIASKTVALRVDGSVRFSTLATVMDHLREVEGLRVLRPLERIN